MAIDNLNYYSAWLPAWQQTDKYSSQPWCLKSKNLDIFSSSKSVKATAWSQASTVDNDVIREEWGLVLKTDWKVYERNNWTDTLFIDPSANFPVYPVSYTGDAPYADATWWTPQDMSVAMEWDEWKSFIVFTDRASFVYSKVKFTYDKSFVCSNFTFSWEYSTDGWKFNQKDTDKSYAEIEIHVDNPWMASFPITIYAKEYNVDDATISLDHVYETNTQYYYDEQTDSILPRSWGDNEISFSGSITDDGGVTLILPCKPQNLSRSITLRFGFTKKEWASTYDWSTWELYIDLNGVAWAWTLTPYQDGASEWDTNYYYSYLPPRDRKLEDVGTYYWMKWTTNQVLYSRQGSWADVNRVNKSRYDFVQYMARPNDPWMDVVWLIAWNEQIYMIGNRDGNWYIIPCDLAWGVWVAYIAYGCTFMGVSNIDYLLYLVWEDRWVSSLWVYNGQELVKVLWWNKESDTIDLIWVDEQYRFDWRMVNWRKNLILTTSDNRIFQYGQTYGGKWGAFIDELPSNATITWLETKWDDLKVEYSITVNDVTTKYSIIYQDDVPVKRYKTEWEAVYPIVLGNHLLEKEESDLFASYILPSSACSLEFRWMANHYHFWTFTSSDDATLSTTTDYKMKCATWTYSLKFIERNGDQYTFRLEWDLPVQTTNDMQITYGENTVALNYTDFNHFRKIWEIITTAYQEWEFRFHNLNNKLELPKSHSLQIMVKGKGTADYTPELFSVDLVANQRERW